MSGQRTATKEISSCTAVNLFVFSPLQLTCVVEESINESTVAKEGAYRGHIIEEAVPKSRVYEGHRLQLHVDEPDSGDQCRFHDCTHISGFFCSESAWTLPIVDKKAVFVYLVLQGEVKGNIFDAFIVVDLHLRGILIRLEVFNDIREPDRQAIIPGVRESSVTSKDQEVPRSVKVLGRDVFFFFFQSFPGLLL